MTDTTLFSVHRMTPESPYRGNKLTDLPKAPTTPATTEPPSAQARLEASRARVRSELMTIAHPPPRASSGLVDKLTGLVKDVPGVELVLDTARHWWSEHRETAQTAGQASQALVAPIARKHPAGMLGAAVAIGALLVLLRPWRLLLRPKVLFGALSLAATQALRSRSASSWLATAMNALGSPKRPRP